MNNLLIKVLQEPSYIRTFTHHDWMVFVQQSYACYLTGRISYLLSKESLLDSVPDKVRWHFESARTLAEAHTRDINIEVKEIRQALKITGVKPVFLKGTAYILAQDDAGCGRTFADVDIYVPKDRLPAVENALKMRGWHKEQLTPYDETYYYKWMHEIPPMVNAGRGTTLDVHHNLTPLTSRYRFNADMLIAADNIAPDVLQPEVRLLHSIVHLFMETGYEKGLRDLSDIDLMIKQFSSSDSSFWNVLMERSEELGFNRLLFYGLRYAKKLLGSPVPELVNVHFKKKDVPNRATLAIMDKIVIAVMSDTKKEKSLQLQISHFALFVRGHWLKMPLHTLTYHVIHKSFNNLRDLVVNSDK